MPFPNAACQTCKSRRIKCDETKPICQRCTKSRRSCIRVKPATQDSFSIHLENCYASGKSKRPRGPRSSLNVLCPQFDLQTKAVGYYLQCHTRPPTDVPGAPQALSECIFVWKVSRQSCQMVDLALTSMALSTFSRLQKHPPAATEACTKYHRLLRIAQEQISNLDISKLNEQNIDACLLAIYLMGRYEAAICRDGDLLSKDSPSFRHHDGAMAILKLWSDSSIGSPATFIMKQTRRGLIRSALLRNCPLPRWILDGSRFGERGIELEFDIIHVQIVDLHYKFRHARQKGDLQKQETEKLDNMAKELDDALQEWSACLPTAWARQELHIEDSDTWSRSQFYSRTVYTYRNPVYGSVWAHYLAARMLVNSTRLSILGAATSSSSVDYVFEQQQLECINRLITLSYDMASTVPFCIERFKVPGACKPAIEHPQIIITNNKIKPHLASMIAWPLTIASSIKGIDPKQQLWFRAELARLGVVLGSGVFELAETNWLNF